MRRQPRGFTLVELLAVLAILALATALAAPLAEPLSPVAADAAASEVAIACRFAQREALRTGAWHAVDLDRVTQLLRVIRLTATGAEDLSNPVAHPLDKGDYRVRFGAGALGAAIDSARFRYENGAELARIGFGPDGGPGLPVAAGATALKNDGVVLLRHGHVIQQVNLDIGSGRVWW